MTLTQLRYFCTAAMYHSITRAANSLFVTQPTISTAIRELEKEFSISLFTHAGNHLSLTEEGEVFYQKASLILNGCDDLRSEYSAEGGIKHRIRIGIPPLLGSVFFPELIDSFHVDYPEIWLELQEFGSVRACELVQDEILDIALVNMELPNIDKFNTLVLRKEMLTYGICKNHHLSYEKTISLKQLHGEPLILFNQDSVQNRIFQSYFDSLKILPKIIMRSSQITTILNFLRQGKCGCFFFESLIPLLTEVTGVPLEPAVYTRVGLVWKRGRHISFGMNAFLNFAKKYFTGNG